MWRAKFHSSNMEIILVVECRATVVMLRKISIRHPIAEKGVFVRRPIKRGSVVGYSYAVLVYGDLIVANWVNKRYGEHVML